MNKRILRLVSGRLNLDVGIKRCWLLNKEMCKDKVIKLRSRLGP